MTRGRAAPAWAWVVLALTFALAALAVGWPGALAVAVLGAGFAGVAGVALRPAGVAAAAALGWAVLLAWDLTGPRAGAVLSTLAGLTRLSPAVAAVVAGALALALPAALAWSGATLALWAVTRGGRGGRAAAAGPPGEVTLPAR